MHKLNMIYNTCGTTVIWPSIKLYTIPWL